VDEDASALGVTFEEGDLTQNVDSSQMPIAMMINSSKLKASGFKLLKVFFSELESAAHCKITCRRVTAA